MAWSRLVVRSCKVVQRYRYCAERWVGERGKSDKTDCECGRTAQHRRAWWSYKKHLVGWWSVLMRFFWNTRNTKHWDQSQRSRLTSKNSYGRHSERVEEDRLKLNLQPNKDGVLECRGRMQRHHTVYIPDTSIYAQKRVEHAHENTLHAGGGSMSYNNQGARTLLNPLHVQSKQQETTKGIHTALHMQPDHSCLLGTVANLRHRWIYPVVAEDRWRSGRGGGANALLNSFEIHCFQGLWTRIHEY